MPLSLNFLFSVPYILSENVAIFGQKNVLLNVCRSITIPKYSISCPQFRKLSYMLRVFIYSNHQDYRLLLTGSSSKATICSI